MAWETRQTRLRSLLGKSNRAFGTPKDLFQPQPPQKMCFQVVVCYMPLENKDPEKFEALCKKHGIETDGSPKLEVFETRYGELDLPSGFVEIGADGTREVYEPVMEVIYTLTDDNIINDMIQDENSEEENALFNAVIALYAPEIEKSFQGTQFRGKYADLTKDSAILFQFIIQPYKPELCSPEDIDVLQPITIIDGHIIKPSARASDKLNFAKAQAFGIKTIP